MVRGVADRAFLPAKSLFEQVGNMMILTGKTMVATVRPPYPYGGEWHAGHPTGRYLWLGSCEDPCRGVTFTDLGVHVDGSRATTFGSANFSSSTP